MRSADCGLTKKWVKWIYYVRDPRESASVSTAIGLAAKRKASQESCSGDAFLYLLTSRPAARLRARRYQCRTTLNVTV